MLGRTLALAVGALTVLAGCEGSDTQFSTRYASDFNPARHTVSVLAVYEDGHISPESWASMSGRLAPALGASQCDVGYNGLVALNDTRTDAIDEFARGDRSGDEVLTQLAPSARGDLILIVRLAGSLPQPGRTAAKLQGGGTSLSPSYVGGHTSGNMGGMPGRGSLSSTTAFEGGGDGRAFDSDSLDMSAAFFSVRESRLVATVSMRYTGASVDDANARFAAKLARSLPEMTCVGWNWAPANEPAPPAGDAVTPTNAPAPTTNNPAAPTDTPAPPTSDPVPSNQ